MWDGDSERFDIYRLESLDQLFDYFIWRDFDDALRSCLYGFLRSRTVPQISYTLLLVLK